MKNPSEARFMIETPKTDAALEWVRPMGNDSGPPNEQYVSADFASQLERENFMLRKLGADLRKSAEMVGYVQSGDDWRKAERRIKAWDYFLANGASET